MARSTKARDSAPSIELPDFLRVTLEAISADDWRGIVQVTVKKALEGDEKARNWLSDYALGKPIARTPAPPPPDLTPIDIRWPDELLETG